MDGKMALYRECCFPKCKKNMVKKVTFLGFRGAIAPIAPLGSAPEPGWGTNRAIKASHGIFIHYFRFSKKCYVDLRFI